MPLFVFNVPTLIGTLVFREYQKSIKSIFVSALCCGNIKEDLQLSDRIYECACGNRMDRDQNAAINICREGIRISGMILDTEKKIS